jgi:hypothetical protein
VRRPLARLARLAHLKARQPLHFLMAMTFLVTAFVVGYNNSSRLFDTMRIKYLLPEVALVIQALCVRAGVPRRGLILWIYHERMLPT